jgi:hypothetical protein
VHTLRSHRGSARCARQAEQEAAEQRRVKQREEDEEEERRVRVAQLPPKQAGAWRGCAAARTLRRQPVLPPLSATRLLCWWQHQRALCAARVPCLPAHAAAASGAFCSCKVRSAAGAMLPDRLPVGVSALRRRQCECAWHCACSCSTQRWRPCKLFHAGPWLADTRDLCAAELDPDRPHVVTHGERRGALLRQAADARWEAQAASGDALGLAAYSGAACWCMQA